MSNIEIDQSWIMAISASVFYDTRLKPMDRELFLVCSALQRSKGIVYASNGYLAACLGVSEATIKRSIKSLRDAGYFDVKIYPVAGGGSKREIRALFDKQCPNQHLRVVNLPNSSESDREIFSDPSEGGNQDLSGGSSMSYNTYSKSYSYSKSLKNSVELGTRPDVGDVDGESPVNDMASLDHGNEEESAVDVQTPKNIRDDETFARDALKAMNEVIGGRYTPTPSNLKGLRARYKEAKQNGVILTVEEIRRMVEWKKHHFTVLNPSMKPYLRPKTLFNGENFEGYMQEAENWDRPKPQEPETPFFPIERRKLNEWIEKTGKTQDEYDYTLTFEQNLNA